MSGAVVAAILCATLLLLAYRPPKLIDRLVRILERVEAAPDTETNAMPADLLSLIAAKFPRTPGQEWAFDGALDSARELYASTRSWDIVRQHLKAA